MVPFLSFTSLSLAFQSEVSLHPDHQASLYIMGQQQNVSSRIVLPAGELLTLLLCEGPHTTNRLRPIEFR